MAFHFETGSGSARATNYQDMLAKMVRMMTSRHIATVAINTAGSGYAVGDLIVINDSVFSNAQHLEAVFEVTSVSAGAITGLRIAACGAYAQTAASATISAGGTGYQVGDLLQVQGGSSRLLPKARVTTVSSGAVTAVSFTEATAGDGTEPGVTATAPSNPAATLGVGNVNSGTAYAGGDDCTLTMTYNPFPTTLTNRPTSFVTGTGTGATIDVTFAESGWAVDGRDTHDHDVNSITNERTVVLKGDASGLTNKPFVGYRTGTATSGLNTRYFIAAFGLVAHNPALAFTDQDFRSPNQSAEGTFLDGGSYILQPQDSGGGGGVDEVDFWMRVDDQHFLMINQLEESAAVSDNAIYTHHYAGFMDRIGTETESPYPMLIFASSRQTNIDPKVANSNITGIAEQRHTAGGPGRFYDNTNTTWRQLQNDDAVGTPGVEENVMLPVGRPRIETDSNEDDNIVVDGTVQINPDFFELDRSSATQILRKIPGTVDQFFLWPLTVARRVSTGFDPTEDGFFGTVKGTYWISSDDGTGSRITNFSEDYVTVGSDRYIVFHNHTQIEPYQYIAIHIDN